MIAVAAKTISSPPPPPPSQSLSSSSQASKPHPARREGGRDGGQTTTPQPRRAHTRTQTLLVLHYLLPRSHLYLSGRHFPSIYTQSGLTSRRRSAGRSLKERQPRVSSTKACGPLCASDEVCWGEAVRLNTQTPPGPHGEREGHCRLREPAAAPLFRRVPITFIALITLSAHERCRISCPNNEQCKNHDIITTKSSSKGEREVPDKWEIMRTQRATNNNR